MKMTKVSDKPRLGQGRAGLRHEIKTLIPINKPVVQAMEKHQKSKHPSHLKHRIKLYQYQIMQFLKWNIGGDTGSRKTIEDVSKEIPIYPDPVYWPPPKPEKNTYMWDSWKLIRHWPRIEYWFWRKFSISRGYNIRNIPRPGKSHFQEPHDWKV